MTQGFTAGGSKATQGTGWKVFTDIDQRAVITRSEIGDLIAFVIRAFITNGMAIGIKVSAVVGFQVLIRRINVSIYDLTIVVVAEIADFSNSSLWVSFLFLSHSIQSSGL
ncbi:hypothetical Protein YC6258_02154 [Gynuella sunshinyii YC6258]|uniref:Uncharacterized protein n=1 Tax=Gynuella sunshinyii YC6258 TaxID=1445510 RepID=A0A0C5VHQ5_9GAMM|nr:hypothetical Protein YC6258_02154 [Gynuella sunshinyii YC6258]